MTEQRHSKLRIRDEDHRKLQRLKESDRVKELAVEKGVIDRTDEALSHEDILLLVTEGADVLSRGDMRWIPIFDKTVHERVMDLAGENVSAHEVVNQQVSKFIGRHQIKLNQ